MDARGRPDPRLTDVLLLGIGVGGLVLCITLVFLAMRAVMDIGGACAEGGPYVPAQACPDGATPALMLGIFGGFGFGALGAVYGSRVGGYGWVPLLGWTGLFATLGWNFLDYGLINPPPWEGGIVWGWVIPGILFEIMAWVPVWFAVVAARAVREGGSRSRPAAQVETFALRDPGAAGKTYEPAFNRPPPVPAGHRVEVVGPVRREELEDIDALMGALIADAAADAPVDPEARAGALAETAGPSLPGAPNSTPAGPPAGSTDGDGSGAFPEGTQALLDRLERLADMRDRGLLTPAEYETAKETVMHELEARS